MTTNAIEVARANFDRMIEGEPWAHLVRLSIGESRIQYLELTPHNGTHGVYIPAHEDPGIMTAWIAHECGHLHVMRTRPFSRLLRWTSNFVSRPVFPPLIRRWLYELFILVFHSEILWHEVCAERKAIQLLRKVGLSVQDAKCAEQAIGVNREWVSRQGPFSRWHTNSLRRNFEALYAAQA